MDQALIDTFGRFHDNLRISVTDRCNIRCFYCMPEEDVKYAPREEILTFEEIERFARIAAGLAVHAPGGKTNDPPVNQLGYGRVHVILCCFQPSPSL